VISHMAPFLLPLIAAARTQRLSIWLRNAARGNQVANGPEGRCHDRQRLAASVPSGARAQVAAARVWDAFRVIGYKAHSEV
jgi:hypothetical protein